MKKSVMKTICDKEKILWWYLFLRTKIVMNKMLWWSKTCDKEEKIYEKPNSWLKKVVIKKVYTKNCDNKFTKMVKKLQNSNCDKTQKLNF